MLSAGSSSSLHALNVKNAITNKPRILIHLFINVLFFYFCCHIHMTIEMPTDDYKIFFNIRLTLLVSFPLTLPGVILFNLLLSVVVQFALRTVWRFIIVYVGIIQFIV